MDSIMVVGVYLLIGFLGGALARKINFPSVTGYIVLGMILSLSGIIPPEMAERNLSFLIEVALGIIGYLIGGQLNLEIIKEFGKQIVIITLTQLLGALFLVTLSLYFLGPFLFPRTQTFTSFFQTYFPAALIIGTISCATAPAAIISIIREYRAQGPMTNTLLSVVAIDDALCIVVYAIGFNVAGALVGNVNEITFSRLFLGPGREIMFSLLTGVILGFALIALSQLANDRRKTFILVMGIILFSVGISQYFKLSNILANMTLGFIVTNYIKHNREVFEVIDDIGDLVFALFFTMAGAFFDLGVIRNAGLLSLVILFARALGKYSGTLLGAVISTASSNIKKYMALGLLPQAGVTVGLIILAKDHPAFSGIENIMVSAVLTTVIINELIAPPLTRLAIIRSGEAYQKK